MKCPLCEKTDPHKVIYFGFPILLCKDEYCSCMYGFWSSAAKFFPHNGWLMAYEGSYWIALFCWLLGWWEKD